MVVETVQSKQKTEMAWQLFVKFSNLKFYKDTDSRF
jgi:hypothetical protein